MLEDMIILAYEKAKSNYYRLAGQYLVFVSMTYGRRY
jgi:hypothetical protein